jgi:hypothetical protein
MKPPLRTKSVGTKVSEAEFAALEERASASGQRLSEWVRGALLSPSPATGTSAEAQVLLAEVIALRTILINLLYSISKSEPLTAEAMRELVERADKDKMRRALERLTAPLVANAKAGTTKEMER